MLHTLATHMDGSVHSIILGDFNFTNGDICTWESGANRWQVEKDAESRTWEDLFSGEKTLRELYQPCMTFQHSRFTSRIDRAYSSLEDGAMSMLCPKA